jgi:mRNA-degrading endonuclease RelE of RelBE toxin-antitoxin system
VSYRVLITAQVFAFAATLAPEPRRRLKRAILGLASERGDLRALTDQLSGWHRLKVGQYRVLFRYRSGRVTECAFAGERQLVYELFEAQMGRRAGK